MLSAVSGSGETGKRTGFKFRRPRGLGGSIPPFRTNPFDKPIARVNGPYVRTYPSGSARRQVIVVFEDGSKTTMSYARWLMTQHLGRRLEPHEHVDHENEDALDDRLENLQILTPGENAAKSNRSRPSPQKGIEKGWQHGTQYAWQKKGCRCEVCEPVWRAWQDARNARRRKKSRVDV